MPNSAHRALPDADVRPPKANNKNTSLFPWRGLYPKEQTKKEKP